MGYFYWSFCYDGLSHEKSWASLHLRYRILQKRIIPKKIIYVHLGMMDKTNQFSGKMILWSEFGMLSCLWFLWETSSQDYSNTSPKFYWAETSTNSYVQNKPLCSNSASCKSFFRCISRVFYLFQHGWLKNDSIHFEHIQIASSFRFQQTRTYISKIIKQKTKNTKKVIPYRVAR